MSEQKDIRWITLAEAIERFGGGSGGQASLDLVSSGDSNDPVAHPYTHDNSGIIVTDANNAEVFRLWASDPDFTDNNNSANLYIGKEAGLAQPTDQTGGYENTGVGYQALLSITTGYGNVALGSDALPLLTDGSQNTAIGTSALRENNGSDNVAVGYTAGDGFANLNQNVFIGSGTAPVQDNITNVIAIGYGVEVPSINNWIMIGNADMTEAFFGLGNAKIHGKGDAIVFPDSDPHVSGAAYWVGGVLTKSNG